jgi:hypothetical protein
MLGTHLGRIDTFGRQSQRKQTPRPRAGVSVSRLIGVLSVRWCSLIKEPGHVPGSALLRADNFCFGSFPSVDRPVPGRRRGDP